MTKSFGASSGPPTCVQDPKSSSTAFPGYKQTAGLEAEKHGDEQAPILDPRTCKLRFYLVNHSAGSSSMFLIMTIQKGMGWYVVMELIFISWWCWTFFQVLIGYLNVLFWKMSRNCPFFLDLLYAFLLVLNFLHILDITYRMFRYFSQSQGGPIHCVKLFFYCDTVVFAYFCSTIMFFWITGKETIYLQYRTPASCAVFS